MKIPYEALSYTWGGTERTETIIANGRSLEATNDLYLALTSLRQEDTDRILWMKAICIDQENARERTHQVRQMARIYESTDTVILWLGQATYTINVALDSLRQLEDEIGVCPCIALSPHLFAVKPSDHAQAILDIMPGRSRDESWWVQKLDLYKLLRKFRCSKATDPWDKVYTIIRTASDSELEEVLSLPGASEGYSNAMVDDQSMTGFLKTIDSLCAAAMDQHLRVYRGNGTTSFYV
ncbi:Heterokaryon incompatibility protein 6 [Diaporthe amygdali]|uniref:Heterokaryon incompatibility protein 6 n=1 Tax=Phomopsis amygdali TaxID=1214568 RepID=UPI0022FDE3B5|nr:Heterokaryon incompatibility protein 6 [Diaporthe amygdali]KAJ0115241.1 Heterokaryon incompatibility protein 6 [Diaporthe amygdali]